MHAGMAGMAGMAGIHASSHPPVRAEHPHNHTPTCERALKAGQITELGEPKSCPDVVSRYACAGCCHGPRLVSSQKEEERESARTNTRRSTRALSLPHALARSLTRRSFAHLRARTSNVKLICWCSFWPGREKGGVCVSEWQSECVRESVSGRTCVRICEGRNRFETKNFPLPFLRASPSIYLYLCLNIHRFIHLYLYPHRHRACLQTSGKKLPGTPGRRGLWMNHSPKIAPQDHMSIDEE